MKGGAAERQGSLTGSRGMVTRSCWVQRGSEGKRREVVLPEKWGSSPGRLRVKDWGPGQPGLGVGAGGDEGSLTGVG